MKYFKLMGLALLWVCGSDRLQADIDLEETRRLHASGAIMSLEHFVQEARKIRPGRLIEAELKYEDTHGRYVYEVLIVGEDGRIWEVEFDAASGEIIEHELGAD